MENKQLETLRNKINEIDSQLITLLAERMKVVTEIGEFKKQSSIQPFDSKRWGQVMSAVKSHANSVGLPEDLVDTIWNAIHRTSLEIENKK